LHQGGVQNVILNSPTADIILPKNKYSKCTEITINIVEFRDVKLLPPNATKLEKT
jgi:phage-related baseplate assembly protein